MAKERMQEDGRGVSLAQHATHIHDAHQPTIATMHESRRVRLGILSVCHEDAGGRVRGLLRLQPFR